MMVMQNDPNLRGLMVDDLARGRRPFAASYGDAGSIALAMSTVPIGLAPSGSMAANGAVTQGTALWQTFSATNSGGVYLYYPAGAVYSGSPAGFYWTVMTNTTAGTVYNNIFDPATTSIPVAPTTPTDVVDAGPGAFTGTTSEITCFSLSIPAYFQVSGAFIEADYLVGYHNSSGTKTVRGKLSGTTGRTGTYTTSNNAVRITDTWLAITATEWVLDFLGKGSSSSAGGITYVATATAGTAMPLVITLQTDAATQTPVIHHLFVIGYLP